MFIFAVAASAAFAADSYGQDCRAADSNLTNGSFTASAKTGGCIKYRFEARPGQRLIVTLRSTDNRARFDLQDGAEDETGSNFYENQTSFDGKLEFEEFTIEVKGTASAGFTLNVKVIDR